MADITIVEVFIPSTLPAVTEVAIPNGVPGPRGATGPTGPVSSVPITYFFATNGTQGFLADRAVTLASMITAGSGAVAITRNNVTLSTFPATLANRDQLKIGATGVTGPGLFVTFDAELP